MNTGSETASPTTLLLSWLPGFKMILVSISLLGLTATNIASVVNASANDWMHNALWRVFSIGGEATANRALADSPRAKRAAIEARHADLDRKYKIQTLALEQANVRVNKLTNQLEINGKRTKATVDTINARIRKGLIRNSKALITESLPFIGAATAVSMTLWDAYDACETMKEFNSLLLEIGQGELNPDICGQKTSIKESLSTKACEIFNLKRYCNPQ